MFVIEIALPKCMYPFTHDRMLIKPILEALPLAIYKSWFSWSSVLCTCKFKLTNSIKDKWKQFWLTTESNSIYPLCNTRALLGYDKDIWLKIVETGLTEETYVIKRYIELDNYQPIKDLLTLPTSLVKVCTMVTIIKLMWFDCAINKLLYSLVDMVCKDLTLLKTSILPKDNNTRHRHLELLIFKRMKAVLNLWTNKSSELRQRFELLFLTYSDSENIYYHITENTVGTITFAIFNLFIAKDESRHVYWRALCRHHNYLLYSYKKREES